MLWRYKRVFGDPRWAPAGEVLCKGGQAGAPHFDSSFMLMSHKTMSLCERKIIHQCLGFGTTKGIWRQQVQTISSVNMEVSHLIFSVCMRNEQAAGCLRLCLTRKKEEARVTLSLFLGKTWQWWQYEQELHIYLHFLVYIGCQCITNTLIHKDKGFY